MRKYGKKIDTGKITERSASEATSAPTFWPYELFGPMKFWPFELSVLKILPFVVGSKIPVSSIIY